MMQPVARKKRYCVDTSVFIESWTKYYSIELCPSYWEVIDQLAKEGRVFSPIEVRRELEKIEDDLFKWAKSRSSSLFADITEDVQLAMRDVIAQFPRLVDSTKQRSIADPWVIAHAQIEKATVVTKEQVASSNKRIKIPDVCQALNIPCIDDFEFYREVGIRFEARLV